MDAFIGLLENFKHLVPELRRLIILAFSELFELLVRLVMDRHLFLRFLSVVLKWITMLHHERDFQV